MKKTIGPKENAMRVLTRREMPEWMPLKSDCSVTIVPTPVMERPKRGGTEDWFGCHWVYDEDCFGFAPDLHKPYVLQDITQWREIVQFPDLDECDWEGGAAKDLDDVDREENIVFLMIEAGAFERTHHLMGFDRTFESMYDEPDEYKELIGAVADYKVKLIDKLAEHYHPDVLFLHDDLGTAHGPMMSMEMYREFIKPVHEKIGQAMKRHPDIVHMHHSCGYMEPFIDDLISTGVGLFNQIQPMNDRVGIAQRYAKSASFDVGVDSINSQYSTEEDVRQEVRAIIDTFGPHGNAFVSTGAGISATQDLVAIAQDEARVYGESLMDRL